MGFWAVLAGRDGTMDETYVCGKSRSRNRSHAWPTRIFRTPEMGKQG